MDFRLDRLGREDAADLIERHALPRQHLARKHGVGLFGEHVVLGEARRVYSGTGGAGRRARSGPSRSKRRHSRLASSGSGSCWRAGKGLPRIAFGKDLSITSAEAGQILRQRQRIGVRAGGQEPQDESRVCDKQPRHQSHPSPRWGQAWKIGDRRRSVTEPGAGPRPNPGDRLTLSGRAWIESARRNTRNDFRG